MELRITEFKILPDFRVRLSYTDGKAKIVDFKRIIAEGGAFDTLSDPEAFSRPQLRQRGHYIEWPGGLDFGADTLYDIGVTVRQTTKQVATQKPQTKVKAAAKRAAVSRK